MRPRSPRPARCRPTRASARRARFLAGVSLLDLKRYDEAFDTFKALAGRASGATAGAA